MAEEAEQKLTCKFRFRCRDYEVSAEIVDGDPRFEWTAIVAELALSMPEAQRLFAYLQRQGSAELNAGDEDPMPLVADYIHASLAGAFGEIIEE